jgi:predicted PurR-regulated permease PerM
MAIDVAIRLAVLGGFAFLVISLIRPFLGLLLWAMILTIALYPVYLWLRARLGARGLLAAIVLTTVAMVMVFGPVVVLLTSLIESLAHFARLARDGALSLPDLPPQVADLPLVGQQLSQLWHDGAAQATTLLRAHGHALVGPGETALRMIAALAGSVVLFATAIVMMGLLFLPGARLAATARDIALRIAGHRGTRFVGVAAATVRSVARGIIGVAALQALLLGIVLIGAGIPHAGLLTLAALVTTIAQIGMTVVILPIVIWVWMTHATGFAIVFSLLMLPVLAVDNLLKPIALGQGLDTPVVVIFAGVIGGAVAFGLPGLFVGPMILAVCYELLDFWLADPSSGDDDDTAAPKD